MKPLTKTLGLLFVCIIIGKPIFSQQLATNKASERQIVCQFISYSVEQDKLLQNEFRNHTQYKIIFSCIPAAMVMIESSNKLAENDIELIKQKLNSMHLSYTISNNLTLNETEAKCASYRSN